MSATGYNSQTVTVGSVSDKILQKPIGSGVQQITPTILAAVFEGLALSAAGTAPYVLKTSNTVIVAYFSETPPFTAQSLVGVFWSVTSGGVTTNYYCLDCTVAVAGNVVTITAPTLSAAQTAGGQTNFSSMVFGTTDTGSDVTISVSTQGTDVGNTTYVQNVDITDYTIPETSLLQLLLTCAQTGAFELFTSSGIVLSWNYAESGDFYEWITGDAAPWSGTVNKVRMYSSATANQVMSIGALMA